ncbi:SGNH/GDSL hydrolase family protein [Fodinicola acaciae]|uniref:SGNH/GDSL hydrolase family protein n=1 Tax=Fodinicola acaciae TaxID=2681555 RepID=UPI0013D7FA7F|nr:GDSL-type esterase/lipase family protein [Fodinicola acaciae]
MTMWLQYTHLEKLYGYLPGMTDALPAIFGLTAEEYAAERAKFDANAAGAAAELLADPDFAKLVDTLPFRDGETVVAVGDSITDDLQSWAEILRHLLRLRQRQIKIVNGGLSAHTTTMILRRWPATVAATKPDWVLCALGGNDVTRIGADPQVDLADSIANLRRMRAMATTSRWLWMTPVPVREERVAQYPPFRFGGSSWRNTDIQAFAEAMRDLDGPLVDLVAAIGVPADPDLQGEDGVHVTLAGQAAIARAVVTTLSSTER